MKWTQALAVVVLACGLAACQKPKQVQPEAPVTTTDGSGAQTSGLGTDGGAGAGTAGQTGAMSAEQRQALAALQSKNVVFFEFDSSEIRSDYVPVVAAHAAYLVRYPTARVRLEGHTDERGSREYNIGLGERRAQTVRQALMLQGVQDGQITTVSYGEEHPAVEGTDEAAFAQNRRVELVQVP